MATTALTSKRAIFLWLALGLAAGFVLANFVSLGATRNAKAAAATTGTEAMRTDILEADFVPGTSKSKTTVWIRGSGFVPGTPVELFIADSNGVLTDISTPESSQADGGGSVDNLAANDDGAWATMWTLGRFTRNGVGAEGMYTVYAYDPDFNLLATTPLALCNLSSRPDGQAVPNYCSQ